MRKDSTKNKIIVLIISLLLAGLAVLAYFLDTSLEWGVPKLLSCIFVNLWILFMLPALRKSYLLNESKSLEEWFKMGLSIGASGILFPALLAPYFGLKYYFDFEK